VNAVAPAREVAVRGKHRTEVTEATEAGAGSGAKSCSVNTVAPVQVVTDWEKHRTEVTEATEGGSRIGG
jgi:hypothetical protein